MTAIQLRQKFMRRFTGMSKYPRWAAWTIVMGYFAQILGGIALGGYLLTLPLTGWSILGMAALMVFIATRQRGLNNIVHECSHASFADLRPDNFVLGRLCASVVLGCFRDYRDEHLTHHAHLGDYEHDLDLQGIRDLRLEEPLRPAVILRHLTNPLLGRHLPYYLRINLSAGDGQFWRAFKIGVIALSLLFTAFFPLTGLLFVIAPFVVVFTTLNYWTDCLDHAGISGLADDLDASRNILAPYPLRVLFFPRNDCFHLVHHLFPQVPARHLPLSHQALCEDKEYVSRSNAVRPFALPERHHQEAKKTATT